MLIAERLKTLREQKKFSQGDLEKRTGLLRCYLSRLENGHTVPSVATLEKIAGALEIPMYRLFTDDANAKKPNIAPTQNGAADSKLDKEFRILAKLLARATPKRRLLFFELASKMVKD